MKRVVKRVQCVGCESRGPLFKITIETENRIGGLCKECYTIPTERFPKTEEKISKLTRAILGI